MRMKFTLSEVVCVCRATRVARCTNVGMRRAIKRPGGKKKSKNT